LLVLHFFFGCKGKKNKDFVFVLTHILFSVIKRLITLLSACAREMADSSAARKQAEGAHRHLEGILANDPKVKFNKK